MHKQKVNLFLATAACLTAAACDTNTGPQPIQTDDPALDIRINVDASLINGSYSLDTGNFPASLYHRGFVSLRDVQNGVLTTLGESWEGGYDELMIVNGNYDSVFEHIDGNLVPQNDMATTNSGYLIDTDQALDIDVPSSMIVPTFTVDGNAFPTSVYDSAEFFLRPAGSEELISLGTTNNQPTDNVMVVPGSYDVIYSIRQGATLPQNTQAVVLADVLIDSTPFALDVNIETNQFNGSWRLALDGVLNDFPGSVYDHADFSLQTDAGDYIYLGPSHTGWGTTPVIAGTYDVVYDHQEGDDVPQNLGKVVLYDLVLPAGRTVLEEVVIAWTVDLTWTLDGNPFPGSVYESAEISLLDLDTGTQTPVGRTHNPVTPLILIEGEHGNVYNHVDGVTIPQNNNAILGLNFDVSSTNTAFDIDISSATVDASFSLDGGDFYDSPYEQADFILQGPSDRGDPVFLGSSNQAVDPVVVLSGGYDVVYQHVAGSQIPRNAHFMVVANEFLDGDDLVTVDVLARKIRPTFTLNNADFPNSPYEQGQILLRGNTADDAVDLGTTASDPEEVFVIRGRYEVLYRHVQGSTVPRNDEAIVTVIDID